MPFASEINIGRMEEQFQWFIFQDIPIRCQWFISMNMLSWCLILTSSTHQWIRHPWCFVTLTTQTLQYHWPIELVKDHHHHQINGLIAALLPYMKNYLNMFELYQVEFNQADPKPSLKCLVWLTNLLSCRYSYLSIGHYEIQGML